MDDAQAQQLLRFAMLQLLAAQNKGVEMMRDGLAEYEQQQGEQNLAASIHDFLNKDA